MKIVINVCYGGFGLSHEAVMRYAELKGFKLYPFVEKKDGFEKYRPYVKGEKAFLIHYSKKPLLKNGSCDDSTYFSESNISRTDKTLIQVVKELGKKANAEHAKLKIIEIPDDVEYQIEEYDGNEWVAEVHKTWS